MRTSEINEVLSYFWHVYPNKEDLSESRATMMVYLADWKAALDHKEQITDIVWTYEREGPHPYALGRGSTPVNWSGVVHGQVRPGNFSDWRRHILDLVVNLSASRSLDEFVQLVYSTFPLFTQPESAPLDLVVLAEKYRTGTAVAM